MDGTSGGPRFAPLCDVSIELAADAPIALGRSPWRNRRVSYIVGGEVRGPRLNGVVRPGGGDWSETGLDADGAALTLVDVRALWTTDDGADIYVTYSGRLVVPSPALERFRDPATVETLSPDQYYFRIAPSFETGDARYGWLNAVMAVGLGRRTARGVDYRIFTLD